MISDMGELAAFPRMVRVRQQFEVPLPVDPREATLQALRRLKARVKAHGQIGIAVGSRGISNIRPIVETVVSEVREAGATPFVIPAMGSHGGATAEGQREILAEYGISETDVGAPVRPSMDTQVIGATVDGVEVNWSSEALRADGIIVINRIKPHTDFQSDSIGSGVLKIMVVGLGKRVGAAAYHAASTRFGYEHMLRTIARVVLQRAPIIGGLGIVENQLHQTARIAALLPDEMETGEAELFREASRLMPKLPLEDIDLLIVDRIGKNISGSGMDPNITGRWVHGYSTMLSQNGGSTPRVRRLFVRDLTAETHGNGIGIGLADITTTRLVKALDTQKTYINALTSLTPNCAKTPIHFETDREAISMALGSLAMADTTKAKIVRIADTLTLDQLEISESGLQPKPARVEAVTSASEMHFDDQGNLL
jgi:uncharacterized Fe-S center protein